MQSKRDVQKEALRRQGKYLQKFNEQSRVVKSREDEEKILKLYQVGKSIREIAEIFNCSEFPITKVLKNVPKRRPSQYNTHITKNQYGENNPAWKGGIKDIYGRFRDLSEYYCWRKQVLDRDNNRCVSCNGTEKLHSHHIITLKTLILNYSIEANKTLADLTREDLLSPYFYNLENGQTLCETCHKKWHKENGG